jgi:hypothetical protein
MQSIAIDGYLVQSKLEQALQSIVGAANWQGREVRLPVGRRRWDMTYQINGQITAVEFDGDEHYRHTLKIKADEEKDKVAREHGYWVVRFPYWVQLTTETLAHYFGLSADVRQDFPHGFITTKIFPASFCELGLLRFERELYSLPMPVRNAVLASLRDRVAEHGVLYVMPKRLQNAL